MYIYICILIGIYTKSKYNIKIFSMYKLLSTNHQTKYESYSKLRIRVNDDLYLYYIYILYSIYTYIAICILILGWV